METANCQLPTVTLSAGDDELPEIWEALLKRIYDGAIAAGDIDNASALHMAENLMNGVTEGYGKDFAQLDYNTPDYIMLEHLEKDVYKFSAAKSFQMNKELTLLLKDGDRTRSFEEWRREALKTVDTWVNAWGKAEYNTVLSTSRNNADYVRFKENGDAMPLIKRSGVGDTHECPICSIYDGLTAPINDPVWAYAYGDLHFQDRCRMLQLASGEATPEDQMPSADAIPKMFRVNMGEKMLAVPPDHPFYTGVSDKKLNKWVNKNLPDRDA